MGAFDKILTGISQTIKMQSHIEHLSEKIDAIIERIKATEKDLRDVDKRLIRIEAYAEIAEKIKKLK